MSSLSQSKKTQPQQGCRLQRFTFQIFQASAATVVTGILFWSAMPVARAEFADIPAMSPAAKYINYLSEKNILTGYPDQTFRPYKPVTRAEFAVMLAKSQNLPINGPAKKYFRDLSKRHWANAAITAVADQGWLKGYPGHLFRPNRKISRAEVYAVVTKMTGVIQLGPQEAEALLSHYRDVANVPNWAKLSMATAVQQGLTTDDIPARLLWPNVNASRADVATVMAKLSDATFRVVPETVANTEPKIPQVAAVSPASTPNVQLKAPPANAQASLLNDMSDDIILTDSKKARMAPPVLAKPVNRLRRPKTIHQASQAENQQVVGLYFSNLENIGNDPTGMMGTPAMRYFQGPDVYEKAVTAILSGPNEEECKKGYFLDEEVTQLSLKEMQISKDGVASVVLEAPANFEFKSPMASERLNLQISKTLEQFSDIKKTKLSIQNSPKTVSQTSP